MKKKPGPYTLPLPALPNRPAWMQGKAHVNGRYVHNAWAHEVFDTWKAGKRPKPVPMPDTEIDRFGAGYPTRFVWQHGTYEEIPVRVRQDVYAWDAAKARWVRCRSPRAIAKYARSA